MEEYKRSPVVIPTLLIHIGLVGSLSIVPAVYSNSLLMIQYSIAGSVLSGLFLTTGLISLRILQKNVKYHYEATLAYRTMDFMILLLTMPLLITLAVPKSPIYLSILLVFTVIMLQFRLRDMFVFFAKSYFILLPFPEPPRLKMCLHLFIAIVNLISLSIAVYLK